MTPRVRYLILGAGPTGIGAALRLIEHGETDFLVREAEAVPGGLARSVVDDQGFTWDLGGHVQFSHYALFDRYMDLALGADGWLEHQRESWIWMRGRFIPYPFQNNLHRLPSADLWRCVQGLLPVWRGESGGAPAADFDEWILRTFGAGVAEVFLRPYNQKVWAWPPAMLGAGWVGERVAVPAMEQVLRGICLGEDQLGWGPNNRFRFPRRGGTGAIWQALAARIPADRLRLGAPVRGVDAGAHTVITDAGPVGYQYLISTLPLDRLTGMVGDPALIESAAGLRWSSVHVVGIGLRGQPPAALRGKCWLYFPEDDCPFYRVTLFSHYSPHNVPDPAHTWSLMAEVSESPHKPVDGAGVVDDVIRGLVNTGLIDDPAAICSRWHRRLGHGYPTPTRDRDQRLGVLLPALEAQDIWSRGRFGAWKYEVSNQDHAFMQGVEVIDHLHRGRPEVTLHRPDLVNGRHNPEPVPEQDRTAGPG